MSSYWRHDPYKLKTQLQFLHDRYFRPVIAYPDGHLCHTGDCLVHRAIDIYGTAPCNCGFLYDLGWTYESVREKLHLKYWEEKAREDGPASAPISDETTKVWLEKAFGKAPPDTRTLEEIENNRIKNEESDAWEWAAISDVFGHAFYSRKKEEWDLSKNKG